MKTLKIIFLILLISGVVRGKGAYADVVKLSSGDAVVGDGLGSSVSISGNYAIAGAPQDSGVVGTESGSVQIFFLSPTGWIQLVKLTAEDAEAGDRFGHTVSISGDYVIVGAPGKSGSQIGTGAAYIFFRSETGWVQQAKLTAPDAEAEDIFGFSVAMDGDTVIIGAYHRNAPEADSGAAYIFVRRGTDWIQQAKLTANDGKAFDWFGYSVAISGDTAIIGAIRNDAKGEDSGAAYIFVRNANEWVQQAKLVGDNTTDRNQFGFAVAVSGNTAVVGSPKNGDTGSAYIFKREEGVWKQQRNRVRLSMFPWDKDGNGFGYSVAISGETTVIGAIATKVGEDAWGAAYILTPDGPFWAQRAKLLASNGRDGDALGFAVAISGDALIAGAPSHSVGGPGSGAAYVFGRDGEEWTERGILFDGETATEDGFGGAVAISGNTAIVGAQQDDDAGSNAGAVYIFVRRTSDWIQRAKLTPNDVTAGDLFGCAVALGGNIAAIGACGDDDAGPEAGSVYIFVSDGINWIQQAKLIANDTRMFDHFGASISIDGNSVIVGAHGRDDSGSDSGAAYVFVSDGARWTQQAKLTANDAVTGALFGFSVSISGDTAIVGAYQNDVAGPDSGAAYIFTRNGTRWTQQVKLSPKDAEIGDEFGYAVSIIANYVIVGAPKDDHLGIDAGSAYIFVYNGANWIQQAKLTATDAASGDEFGASVAMSGDYAIVGAWKDDQPVADNRDDPADQIDKGSAYTFLRSGFSWGQKIRVIAPGAQKFDLFGVAVSISGKFAIVGAPQNDDAGSDAGAAYAFDSSSLFGEVYFPVEPSSLQPTMLGQIKQTALLQNYPNPFNPETWIPYRLATASKVEISIYDIDGHYIRTIQVGTQPEGEYIARSKAAYWDGRSDTGEPVSSGIYFYHLKAGAYHATRRMIILK